MTKTSTVLVKLFVLVIITISIIYPPISISDPLPPIIEKPVVITSPTTTPVKTKNVTNKIKTKDCTEYKPLIMDYDWPVETAMQICKDESRGHPVAVGDTHTKYVSCGLMQIRALPGRPTCEEMKIPKDNIAYAYGLWQKEGFCPWTTFKDELGDCQT